MVGFVISDTLITLMTLFFYHTEFYELDDVICLSCHLLTDHFITFSMQKERKKAKNRTYTFLCMKSWVRRKAKQLCIKTWKKYNTNECLAMSGYLLHQCEQEGQHFELEMWYRLGQCHTVQKDLQQHPGPSGPQARIVQKGFGKPESTQNREKNTEEWCWRSKGFISR